MDTYISIKINSTKNKKEMNKIFSDIDYIYSSYHKLTSRYDKYDGLVNVYYLNEVLDNDTEVEIDSRLSDIINIDSIDGVLVGDVSSDIKEVDRIFERL